MTPNGFRKMFIAFFLTVVAIFILSPFLEDYGSVRGLNGTPGIIDYWNLWSGMHPVSALGYFVGDLLCHQEFGRSLILNGSQMPICIRDFAALLGLIAGLYISEKLQSIITGKRLVIFTSVVFVLLIADILVQSVFSMNVFLTRGLTGAMAGIAVGLLIDYALRRM